MREVRRRQAFLPDSEPERADHARGGMFTVGICQRQRSGLLPHALCLKPSCLVMLLRNLNPTNSLCNGTRLIMLLASRKLLRYSILRTRRYSEIV